MQGIIILAIISTEQHSLIFDLTLNSDTQWSGTCRSRVPPGQGAYLLSKSRTITIQCIIILATIRTEKYPLVFYST